MLQILHHPAYYKDGAFLPAPAFPPTVPILQEGRAAFSPPRQARRQQAACPHPAFQAKNALNCI